MKQSSADNTFSTVTNILLATVLLLSIFLLNSFTVHRIGDDFMKQLGITKTAADQKITNSVLGGSLDAYGLKNMRNIATGNRGEIAKDLLVYTKSYLASPAFTKEYQTLKENNKPKKDVIKTPAEVKSEYIASIKKMIADSEKGLKTANSTMKPVYEKMLAEGNKQLKDAESPDNKYFTSYEKNYPQMMKDLDTRHEAMIKEWESVYPADANQFIKRRLEEFLKITSDIDFSAELVTKNGKKVFVNPAYEDKDSRWKMAFRAGKEVVEPARAFVQQWVQEIK
jgi:hypothetical protein